MATITAGVNLLNNKLHDYQVRGVCASASSLVRDVFNRHDVYVDRKKQTV
jgi:hypothetical protein